MWCPLPYPLIHQIFYKQLQVPTLPANDSKKVHYRLTNTFNHIRFDKTCLKKLFIKVERKLADELPAYFPRRLQEPFLLSNNAE